MIAHVINPGSSSVKLACATLEPSLNPALPTQLRVTLERAELPIDDIPDQAALDEVARKIVELTQDWPAPAAIVGRGGQLGRVPAGTYVLTPELAGRMLECGDPTEAPENLGAPLAYRVAQQRGVPGFIVDPQSVDELLPEAHMTGITGVRRDAQFHALNARAVARRAAHEIGKRFRASRIVVAHFGSTTSVTAFDEGRAIDTTGTAPNGGPLGARQSGPLPARTLLKLARDYSETELMHLLTRESGFFSLAGSADLKDLERRVSSGEDTRVQTAIAAFIHQACKAIGEQTAALPGRPDAIAITGGIARWDEVVDRIERRLAWIAPVIVIPGELELEALAEGAGRVLLGLENVREWTPQGVTSRPLNPNEPSSA